MTEIKKGAAEAKTISKKELVGQIRAKTGKSFQDLDSLMRANKETIEWVLELVS